MINNFWVLYSRWSKGLVSVPEKLIFSNDGERGWIGIVLGLKEALRSEKRSASQVNTPPGRVRLPSPRIKTSELD